MAVSASEPQANTLEALINSCDAGHVALPQKEWLRVFGEKKKPSTTAAGAVAPGGAEATAEVNPTKRFYYISRWSPYVTAAQPLQGIIELLGIQFEFELVYDDVKELARTAKASKEELEAYVKKWEQNNQTWGTKPAVTPRTRFGNCPFVWVSAANELTSIQGAGEVDPWIWSAAKRARYIYTLPSSSVPEYVAEYYTDWFATQLIEFETRVEDSTLNSLFQKTSTTGSKEKTLAEIITTLKKSTYDHVTVSTLVQQRLTKPGSAPQPTTYRIGRAAKTSLSTTRVFDMQAQGDTQWRRNRYSGAKIMKFPYEKLLDPRSQLL